MTITTTVSVLDLTSRVVLMCYFWHSFGGLFQKMLPHSSPGSNLIVSRNVIFHEYRKTKTKQKQIRDKHMYSKLVSGAAAKTRARM